MGKDICVNVTCLGSCNQEDDHSDREHIPKVVVHSIEQISVYDV